MISTTRFLQLDWLAFTFKPLDEPFTKDFYYPDLFKSYFPELVDVLASSVESPKYRSNYSHTVNYNDGDIFFGFNTIDDDMSTSKIFDVLNSGMNVQVPSHSLDFFFSLFGLDLENPDVVPQMLDILAARCCFLSRIDLCFDDFSKTFTVDYYRKAWAEDRIQSPYINSIQCIGSHKKGFTLYVGSLKKRTKLLRIYDKFLESDGEVDSVRYEFELHSDAAKSIMNMIRTEYRSGIPFAEFLYAWMKVKDHSISSGNLSMVADDEAWSDFITNKTYLANSDDVVFLPIRVPAWNHLTCSESIKRNCENNHFRDVASYIDVFGMTEFLDQIKREKRRNKKIMDLRYKLNASQEYELINKDSFFGTKLDS